MTESLKKKNYRKDIEGLRALAVLAVIFNHFSNKILPSGHLGVDIFFVISGNVISSSFSSLENSGLKEFLLHFYSRRVRRLVPALVCYVSIASVVVSILNPSPRISLFTGLFALFGLSNVYLFKEALNYFGGPTSLNAFTQTWSLGVEEQFYLLFPLIIWLTGFPQNKSNSFRKAFIFIGFLSAVSFICFFLMYTRMPNATFYLVFFRLWELGLGALSFFLIKTGKLPATLRKTYSFAFILLVFSLFLPVSLHRTATLWAVMLTAWVITNPLPNSWPHRLLTSRLGILLGRISYSLYLWHWGVLIASRFTIGVTVWTAPLQLGLTLLLALASYKFIEHPLRVSEWSPSKIKTIAFGLTSIICCFLLIVALGKPLKGKLLAFPIRVGGPIVHSKLNCEYGNPNVCLNRISSKRQIFTIGDSHAINLVPSLQMAAKKLDWNIVYWGDVGFIRNIFSTNCVPADQCYNHELSMLSEIFAKNLRPDDLVIFSMSTNRIYLPNHYEFEGKSRRGHEDKSKLFILEKVLRKLTNIAREHKAEFLIVDDIPALCSDFDAARSGYDPESCRVSAKLSLDDRMPLTQVYYNVVQTGALYLDPHSEMCGGEFCRLIRNGSAIYGDTSPHISEANRDILYGFFGKYFATFRKRSSSNSDPIHSPPKQI